MKSRTISDLIKIKYEYVQSYNCVVTIFFAAIIDFD